VDTADRPGSGSSTASALITSVGFVLAATFAVLATIRLRTLTEIGFTVAFGIMLDTIAARSVLVTTLNLTSATGCGGPARWPASPTRHQQSSAASAPPP
jgi:RND superfamily putative drug exporter